MTRTFNELFPPRHNVPLSTYPLWKRILRIIYDASRGFIEDDCYSKASALTFYTLLSIVPILAVLFGIAKGFGYEKALESDIIVHFSEQKEFVNKLVEFAYSALQNVRGGLIAGVGVFVLLWSVIGLLSCIENSLNDIWKIPVGRSFNRKLSDYLAALLICPIFLIVSSSITVYLSTQIAATGHTNVITEAVRPVLLYILQLSPYFLSWVLFTFVYLFMPNTTVYLRSALIAGIVAGSAFQFWQWIYIQLQLYVLSYGAIYGSFAALPLFLVWLQVSWLILLAGAELAFEIENDLFIPFRESISLRAKGAALLMTFRCIEAFVKGLPPPTDRMLAHELGISLNHLHMILEALMTQRILSSISFRGKSMGYQPARGVESITFADVNYAIDKSNELQAAVEDTVQFRKILEYLDKSEKSLEDSPLNHPLYQALKD